MSSLGRIVLALRVVRAADVLLALFLRPHAANPRQTRPVRQHPHHRLDELLRLLDVAHVQARCENEEARRGCWQEGARDSGVQRAVGSPKAVCS